MVTEFWEGVFQEKQLMWGPSPTPFARAACETFEQAGITRVLIPGIGYGRNATPFLERQMTVAGIEISATAIELASSHLGRAVPIVHGSVADMPFDHQTYGGVFSHALVHLLDAPARSKFIRDCYSQLQPGGLMILTAISKRAPFYGQGARLGEDWYERFPGVSLYFYDAQSIEREFGAYGLVEVREGDEPAGDGATLPFFYVVCRRGA